MADSVPGGSLEAAIGVKVPRVLKRLPLRICGAGAVELDDLADEGPLGVYVDPGGGPLVVIVDDGPGALGVGEERAGLQLERLVTLDIGVAVDGHRDGYGLAGVEGSRPAPARARSRSRRARPR
ncbi:MAG: hypothetical protein M3375_09235 [Actinomycetota bacterium]|nr:hypothetical protein [Actinomycetota bacterium]